MRGRSKLATAALASSVIAAGALAMASAASAEVVCNQWNECWHVHHYTNDYPADVGIVVHPDDWRGHHYHWRADRDDHGYYRNGVWVTF
jgi:hypothetical protein